VLGLLDFGIGPLVLEDQLLGALDTGLLWGNLGVSLLVIVAGTILVPALSLPAALLSILAGCLIGNLMLGTAAAIGAQARLPGRVLVGAPLGGPGIRGRSRGGPGSLCCCASERR